jgi:Asp-tRNA(Asn)/Glu-tRNA(Gln) amidotransferase A subunit family amidase
MTIAEYDACDAVALADLVRRREVSPAELLEEAIARVERLDPRVNAVVLRFYERARAEAKGELPEGALRGVPFLIKNLVLQLAGTRTTNGCRLFEDAEADHDSELVARYRRAGLVIFGKTHSSEFGLTTSSESKLFGQTRNPWDPGRSAGGSSGGAAAAVAVGILPAANATDGGGSIRIPASCCGVFGLKPTRARTPLGPDAGEGWSGMSTLHAVTRSVRDSAVLLDATHGPDLGAPYQAPPPERPWAEEVGRDPGRLRIALQTETWNGAPTHPDCAAAAEDAARLLASLGHDVVPTRLVVDAAQLREATLTIIAANLRFTLEDRAAALGRELAAGDVEPITWLMAASAKGRDSAAYASSIRALHGAGRQVEAFLRDFDAILSPTLATPPPPLGVLSLSNPDLPGYLEAVNQTIGYTQLFNASGHPAASLPLHRNAAGLPIGVQLAARLGDEATLFRLSAQLERARPWVA